MSFSSVKFVYLFVVFPLLLIGCCEVTEKMVAFLLYITSITSWMGSSLSVFALHPLYLRVQALSRNIPEDIKVPFNLPCNMSINIYMAIHLLNILRVKSTLFLGSQCWFFLFMKLQKEILQEKERLDGKVIQSSESVPLCCNHALGNCLFSIYPCYTHFRNVHDHFQLLFDSQ